MASLARVIARRFGRLDSGLFVESLKYQAAAKPCVTRLDIQQRRWRNTKHYDIRWRKERSEKYMKIELPDYDERREADQADREGDGQQMMQEKMKEQGRLPPRKFHDRPFVMSCTSAMFEPYVPPEGDGRSSKLTKKGMKDTATTLSMKGVSFRDLRKVRRYEDNFDSKQFAEDALNIYTESHDLLQYYRDEKAQDRLHDLVTESVYPKMTLGLETKTLRWKFSGSIEPSRIVHVRIAEMMAKDNLYGQITVRLHTKQALAVYDRFGRLMYGSEKLIKDVLEYVVFEKHLSDTYGIWRVHGKLLPDWLPKPDPVKRTFRKPRVSEFMEGESTRAKNGDENEMPPDNSP